MLKLINLKKDYKLKGQEPVHALKGISLNFRRNDFVAILGPSGCGKTTLLNLIGGLDRYSDGDLVIEGKSTKYYGDHDWDTYRNHSIGFVFQSYNLISHQTILKNVELALTISGINKKDRRSRAMKALDEVGLKGLYNKKPNQLSGGQMQRVAIARSLVNNPEILLADEPTGALDSETSVQIMDLLKEVASNRLVIMVTHNPELAEQYATRIVKMKDGLVLDDSNPFGGETKEELATALKAKKETHIEKGKSKSSMSFITATGLSFSNLLSKIKRTVLVTIAGSIGIIGVSAVLAVSQGVSNYVNGMQDDMLSSYPVTITETSVDYASLMGGLSNWDKKDIVTTDLSNKVAVDSMISYLMDKYQDFTSVKSNDINQDLIDFINEIPSDLLSAIDYNYNIDLTNNVFTSWKKSKDEPTKMMSLNGLTQMYIAELQTVEGFSEYAQFVDLFTNFMKQLPGDEEYILNQYDLIGENSRFAENANEIMLVVDENQSLTDISLAQLGFFNEEEFLNIAKYAIEVNKEKPNQELLAKYQYPHSFSIDDVIGKQLTYYPHDSIYSYEEKQIDNIKFEFSEVMVGPASKVSFAFDLYYDESDDTLTGELTIMDALTIPIVFDRTGTLDENSKVHSTWAGTLSTMDMSSPISLEISGDLIHKAKMNMVLDYETDFSHVRGTKNGYRYNTEASSELPNAMDVKIVGVLKAKPDTQFGCLSRGVYYTPKFTLKYITDSINSALVNDIESFINSDKGDASLYRAYTTFKYTSFRNGEDNPYEKEGEAVCLNLNMSGSFSSIFGVTQTAYIEYNRAYLRSLSGQSSKEQLDGTYVFESLPNQISIYPKDFTKKNKILSYLDQWNEEKDLKIDGHVLTHEDRDEVTYTDTIGMIITVIDTLINAITIALVAFTSLSLVVSCFMIAVITYISTMERVKEIGIIRSLGGRKKDVSRLFIAETLIIGLASGIFGILCTEGICAILNVIVAPFGVSRIAVLMPLTIIIMILLSVLLNVLSGLIPSMHASKQDPVIALRSE